MVSDWEQAQQALLQQHKQGHSQAHKYADTERDAKVKASARIQHIRSGYAIDNIDKGDLDVGETGGKHDGQIMPRRIDVKKDGDTHIRQTPKPRR